MDFHLVFLVGSSEIAHHVMPFVRFPISPSDIWDAGFVTAENSSSGWIAPFGAAAVTNAVVLSTFVENDFFNARLRSLLASAISSTALTVRI